jgi:hypothetical protein
MSVCLSYSRAVVGLIKQQQHEKCPIMRFVVGPSRGVLRLARTDDTNCGREKLEMDVVRIRHLMKILRQVLHPAALMHAPTIIRSLIK